MKMIMKMTKSELKSSVSHMAIIAASRKPAQKSGKYINEKGELAYMNEAES